MSHRCPWCRDLCDCGSLVDECDHDCEPIDDGGAYTSADITDDSDYCAGCGAYLDGSFHQPAREVHADLCGECGDDREDDDPRVPDEFDDEEDDERSDYETEVVI